MGRIGLGLGLGFSSGDKVYTGPLDAYAGRLYGGYGLRRLLASYTGPLVRVRRSSDNAESDIGYTVSGALDTTALLAFAWSGSAYVRTWYDQTGAGRHALQATTAAQGRIVNAGTLDTGPNGSALIVFSGAQYYEIQNALGFARNASALTIAANVRATGSGIQPIAQAYVAASTSARASLAYTNATSLAWQGRVVDGGTLYTVNGTVGASTWARLIGRARYAAGSFDLTVDGATLAEPTAPSQNSPDTDSFSLPRIGASSSSFLTGQLGTVVLARTALDPALTDSALTATAP